MFWFIIGVLVGHGLFCATVAIEANKYRPKKIKVKHIKGSYVIPIKRH